MAQRQSTGRSAFAALVLAVIGHAAAQIANSADFPAAPEVGTMAPAFRLQDQAGAWHNASDYRGKWLVLYFYPKDDTPGCTAEACGFRDLYEEFTEAGAEVVGVSSDSEASHQRFAGKHKLRMRLLTDADGTLRQLYGVRSTLGIWPGRATFVIDRDGIVRHVFASQLRIVSHVGQALDVVRTLGG